LAALHVVSHLLLLGAISAGLLSLYLLAAERSLPGIGQTTAEVEQTLATLIRWKSRLESAASAWAIFAGAALMMGLIFHAHQSARRRFDKEFERLHEREMRALIDRFNAGERFEGLPPTPEMSKLSELGGQAMVYYEKLLEKPEPDNPEYVEAVKDIGDKLDMIRQQYALHDLSRRCPTKLDPDAVELPPPRHWRDRLGLFFMSRGLVGTTQGISRAFAALGVLLVIPCFLSAGSIPAGASLEPKRVELDQVRLERRKADQQQVFLAQQEQLRKEEAIRMADRLEKERQEQQRLNDERTAALQALNDLGKNGGGATLTASQHAVIAQVAYHYERLYAEHLTPKPTAEIQRGRQSMAAQLVEESVLERAQKRFETVERHRSTSELEILAPKQREALKAAATVESAGPTSAFGKLVQEDLTKAALRDPSFVEIWKGKLAAFQKPAGGNGLGSSLAAHALNSAVPGSGDLLLAMEAQRARFVTELSQAGPSFESAAKASLENTSRPLARAEELAALRGRMSGELAKLNEANLVSELGRAPPSIDEHFKPVSKNLQESIERIHASDLERLRGSRREGAIVREQLSALTESAATFSDYMPAQHGIETRTTRGLLDRSLIPPSIPLAPIRPVAPSGSSFARSRSFARLRGFSRIGGVLIGRDPDAAPDEPPLDVRDLRWERSAENPRLWRFKLIHGDGKETTSRYFHDDLLFRALAYAADGRPVGVTMVSASPLWDLKILVHPALLDSGLGQRIIDLDRFVDQFTGMLVERRQAHQDIDGQIRIYSFAWAEAILAVPAETWAGGTPQLNEFFKTYQSYAKAFVEAVAKDARELKALLEDHGWLSDKMRSPIPDKPEFFSAEIVSLMKTALDTDSTLSSLSAKMKPWGTQCAAFWARNLAFEAQLKDFQDRVDAYNHALVKTETEERRLILQRARLEKEGKALEQDPLGNIALALFAIPPVVQQTMMFWSGVREREYTPQKALLSLASGYEESLLEFMEQTAFGMAPLYLNPSAAKQEPGQEWVDLKPWEFGMISSKLHNTVLSSLDKPENTYSREIYGAAIEFTLAQRLFRLAFKSRLGTSFPLQRLDELSAELDRTLPKAEPVPTPRWQLNQTATEARTLQQLRQNASSGGKAADDQSDVLENMLNTLAKEGEAPIVDELRKILKLFQLAVDNEVRFQKAVAKCAQVKDPTARRKEFDEAWKPHEEKYRAYIGSLGKLEALGAVKPSTEGSVAPVARAVERSRRILLLREEYKVFESVKISLLAHLQLLPPLYD
jgi:hypothetical protein